MTEFQQLTDEIFGFLMRTNPVWATTVGIHDHDDKFPHLDEEHRQERVAQLKDYERRLTQFLADGALDSDDSIDCRVLHGLLQTDLIEEESFRRVVRDPTFALQLALYGCYKLVSGEFAPIEQRLESLIARLDKVPDLLAEARSNLSTQKQVPTVWAEMAEELGFQASMFFGNTIPGIGQKVSALAESLHQAGGKAAMACVDYALFVREQITERTAGSYAVGHEAFEQLLSCQHGLQLGADELTGIGQAEIERLLEEVSRLADSIEPGTDAVELVGRLKEEAPTGDLLDAYQSEVNRLREFVLEKDLVSIPDGEALDVVETPEFARPMYPFAAYSDVAPFDEKSKGCLWVTPIDSDAPEESQLEQRRGQNRHSLILIALHETYPGHHLQFVRAVEQTSKIRRLSSSSLFAEGWALYCEELMGEAGYYHEPGTRLMQLVHQLWRACRVVIDTGLHCGRMTFTDGVNLLCEVADMDRINAIAEVKRYTQYPTQPLSYMIGKIELMKLREECRRAWGQEFALKNFHDRLLSYGTIPFNLVAPGLLEQIH